MSKVVGPIPIMVTAYERPELLRACLESLRVSDYDGFDVEVCISDDRSPSGDIKRVIFEAMGEEWPCRVSATFHNWRADWRKHFFRHAKELRQLFPSAPVYPVVESDVVVHPDWLQIGWQTFRGIEEKADYPTGILALCDRKSSEGSPLFGLEMSVFDRGGAPLAQSACQLSCQCWIMGGKYLRTIPLPDQSNWDTTMQGLARNHGFGIYALGPSYAQHVGITPIVPEMKAKGLGRNCTKNFIGGWPMGVPAPGEVLENWESLFPRQAKPDTTISSSGE